MRENTSQPARHDRSGFGSLEAHAFFSFRICRNRCLFSLGRTPFAPLGSGESYQTLFRTVPSPLRARFPPNASDMQAPGLPPRPGAVALGVMASTILSHRERRVDLQMP